MMSLRVPVGILILSFCLNLSESKLHKKPEFLQTCDYEDNKFSDCSTGALQSIVKQLVVGIEGLEEVPPTDPMLIDKLDVSQNEGAINLQGLLSNIKLTGVGNMNIMRSDLRHGQLQWNGRVLVPKVVLQANCQFNGRVFIIPFSGNGPCTFEPTSMDVKYSMDAKLYEKDSQMYFNGTNLQVDYTIEGLSMNLKDVFGIKILGEIANSFLNSNWKPIHAIMKPVIAEKIREVLKERLLIILELIPADYLVSNLPSETSKGE